jgi:hypothetical protein
MTTNIRRIPTDSHSVAQTYGDGPIYATLGTWDSTVPLADNNMRDGRYERYDMAEPLARAVETLTDRDATVWVSLTPCCRRDRPPSRPLLAAGRHGSQRRLDFV